MRYILLLLCFALSCMKKTSEPIVPISSSISSPPIVVPPEIRYTDFSIQVYPVNSVISGIDADGKRIALQMGENRLAQGVWQIEIYREGWEPQYHNIDLQENAVSASYTLVPKEHVLHFNSHPKDATITVLRNNSTLLEGKGFLDATITAGEISIETTWKNGLVKQSSHLIEKDEYLFHCPDLPFQKLKCIRVIHADQAPKSVRYSPDGNTIWTALLVGPPSVKVFSAHTGEMIKSIDLGSHGGVEIEFSSDGSRAWVSQMHTSSVFEIDTTTYEVLRQLPSKSSWTKVIALSKDEQTLYVSNWVGNTVSAIDLETGTVQQIWKTDQTPRGLVVTKDNTLLVASFATGTVQSIDLITNEKKRIFTSARSARHLVLDEDSGRLYISDLNGGKVWVLDMNTMQSSLLAKVERNPNTIQLSPDKKLLFVSCRGRNNPENYVLKGPEYGAVFVLDAFTGTVLDVIVGGNQPTGLDVSPDGKFLAFSDFLDHKIKIYEIPPSDELRSLGYREEILQYKQYLLKK